MSTMTDEAPDYSIDDEGNVVSNEATQLALDELRRLDRLRQMLDGVLTGAVLLAMFKRMPWLQRFELSLGASAEFDDSGGTHRSINHNVKSVAVVEGVEPSEEIMDEGTFCEAAAIDLLEEYLNDTAGDIYFAFVAPNEYSDIELSLDRGMIQDLLERAEMSGRVAFTRFFPANAEVVAAG